MTINPLGIRFSGAATALALALSFGSLPALAQTGEALAGDHNGAREIGTGDYQAAERVLAASLRTSPGDPELMLNLATVYRRSGRVNEAKALYRAVLAQPDETLVVGGNRAISSHALADSAVLALGGTRLSAR